VANDDRPSALALLKRARHAMDISQAAFARELGVSPRTHSRWNAGEPPGPEDLRRAAQLVQKLEPELVAPLLEAAHLRAVSIGVEAPRLPAVPTPVRSPGIAAEHLADSVVCAAAEASGVPPAQVRRALRAAFTRTLAVGLTVEQALTALGAEA
jgi:transcriptional regulator with XRE-family HTH domain